MLKGLVENFIGNVDIKNTEEIRVRANLPIEIMSGGVKVVLKNGNKAKIATQKDIADIIAYVTDNSFYAYETQFARGFLSYYGSKIAICGEAVYQGKELVSFRNITSLCIRIPREVKGIADKITAKTKRSDSILLIGMTATGKTTMLRELARKTSDNTLVVDERKELYLSPNSLGDSTDVIFNMDKVSAIEKAIRGLNPSIIITDELYFQNELEALKKAKQAGISVISSFHGSSLESYFTSSLCEKNLFDKYVVLENQKGKGEIQGVYNQKGELL